jgi:anthranilate synthase component 1
MVMPDRVILQAGAGIVADSVDEMEYQEVHNKLGALMSSLDDLKAK